MQYISSDTNVWIDFFKISRIDLPFRLPYIYVMHTEAIENELCSPKGIAETLKKAGLVGVPMTTEEFFLADTYGTKYLALSIYDRIALAIAKCRKITLLTGDKPLRNAAEREDVQVIGTLGIIDQLRGKGFITVEEYRYCLESFKKYNGGEIRLPEKEIDKRLSEL